MRKTLSITMVFIVAVFTITSCGKKKETVSFVEYADTASYFAHRIANLETKQDMQNIELFLQISDSIAQQKALADTVLSKLFASETDTLFLPFTQTKNKEKLEIKKVWVKSIKFDKILLEAIVESIDNSSFMGPHVGLVIQDKNNKSLEVGGGIQGPTDEKLDAGHSYLFTGQIDNLHLLSDFKSLLFDEEIKKW